MCSKFYDLTLWWGWVFDAEPTSCWSIRKIDFFLLQWKLLSYLAKLRNKVIRVAGNRYFGLNLFRDRPSYAPSNPKPLKILSTPPHRIRCTPDWADNTRRILRKHRVASVRSDGTCRLGLSYKSPVCRNRLPYVPSLLWALQTLHNYLSSSLFLKLHVYTWGQSGIDPRFVFFPARLLLLHGQLYNSQGCNSLPYTLTFLGFSYTVCIPLRTNTKAQRDSCTERRATSVIPFSYSVARGRTVWIPKSPTTCCAAWSTKTHRNKKIFKTKPVGQRSALNKNCVTL